MRSSIASSGILRMDAGARTTILVVEDNVDDTFLLKRQLARAHFDDCVTVIGNGQDAYDFLQRATEVPLAIFLDLKLPGLNGVDLLQKIRQTEKLKDIAVIVMTGSADPKDMEVCEQLGVTAYLPKPVALTTFIKTVTHLFPVSP